MNFEKIRDIVCDLFGCDPDCINEETTFDELGAGDMDMIDIAMSIEDEFSMECPDEALEKFITVGDAVRFTEGADD